MKNVKDTASGGVCEDEELDTGYNNQVSGIDYNDAVQLNWCTWKWTVNE